MSANSFDIWIFLASFIITGLTVLCSSFLGKQKKRYPKGPLGLPLVGHLPFFGSLPTKTFQKWQKQYGDVFSIRMGSWTTVVINGYDVIKEAVERTDDVFSGRPPFTTRQLLRDIHGGVETLVFGRFDSGCIIQRKITAAALRLFTKQRVESTQELVLEESDILVRTILANQHKPQDIRSEIHTSIGSILYQIVYGRGNNVREHQPFLDWMQSDNDFVEFAKSGSPYDVLPWLKYLMPGRISQFVEIASSPELVRQKCVKEHMETFDDDNIRDVVDVFLAAPEGDAPGTVQGGLNKERLMHTVYDIIGAGVFNVTLTLQWAMLYMVAYPYVQQQVFEEIIEVTGNGRAVLLNDRSKLSFTDATLHEVMRTICIAPFGIPHFSLKDTKLHGYDIDKETVLLINLHSVAHDESFWGDPDTFRPERFLGPDGKIEAEKMKRISMFGYGRRGCLGETLAKMELLLMFATLIQRCEFRNPEGQNIDLTPQVGLTYRPSPYMFSVIER